MNEDELILAPEDAALLLDSWSYYDTPTKALWDRLRACAALVTPPLNGDVVWSGLTARLAKNGTPHNQCKTVVRARSEAEAVRLLQAAGEIISASYFSNHWSVTGNRESLCQAVARGVWVKGTEGWIKAGR